MPKNRNKRGYLKPPFIKNGLIAIVAPSFFDHPEFDKQIKLGVRHLKKLGFNVIDGPYLFRDYPYTERGYRRRALMINAFFSAKRIKGLICEAGGSGAEHIIEFLDKKSIKNNPKLFCGYSDSTSLLLYLNDKLKIVVFHGPSIASGISDLNPLTKRYLLKILTREEYPLEVRLGTFDTWKKGKATGKVIGGNLTVLLDYLDLFPETNFRGKILFIEDYNLSADKINHLVYRLKKAGVFNKVKGILLGRFIGLEKEHLENVKKHLMHHLKGKNIPVLYGFKSGHGFGKIMLPFGVDVTLNATARKVVYEECPFQQSKNQK
ncbi:LD-carboxypeptidase [Candidatus Woesearchaeota archaeon]|nr:LD-carboxypeptidase [Candidatus Woesearchaeota archaeon]